MHLNVARIEVEGASLSGREVHEALASDRRVAVIDGASSSLTSTAQLMEAARDMGRVRGDISEIVVWRDSIMVRGRVIRFAFAVHNESVVVPESIDCARALAGLDSELSDARHRTDVGIEKLYGAPLDTRLG